MINRSVDIYLHEMISNGASDLFLTEGCSPSLRIEDRISPLNEPPLSQSDIEALIESMLNEDQLDEFRSTLELNVALELKSGERFRVNVFRQRYSSGMVIRLIKSAIPTIEGLGLPQVYKDLIMKKRGLILMVGASGAGKSTSMAAMLGYRNKHGEGHIISIEDPIEFVHEHQKCIFTQREIGVDTYSYGIALKNALRQSPDVLVIGEIRDKETLENAILFCETGHLVIATLHANNSNQAIERIINMFPEEMKKQVLATLAMNVKAIISQRLVEGIKDKRVLAYEILVNEGLITTLIEEGKIKEMKELMGRNRDQGMITFDQCLFEHISNKRITADVAIREADNPSNLRLKIHQQHHVYSSSENKLSGDAKNINYGKEDF